VLILKRQVPVTPTPVAEGYKGPLDARLACLHAQTPASPASPTRTKLGERSQELDRLGKKTTLLGDVVRKAASRFSSRRSFFSEESGLRRLVHEIVDGGGEPDQALARIADQHTRRAVLMPRLGGQVEGWFAELSSMFDPELGAVTIEVEHDHTEDREVTVYDAEGQVLHRRVTSRRSPHDG